jgi:hypothetical protein
MKRALVIAALLAAGSMHPAAINNAVPVLTGLNGPRGVAPGPAGRLIFGEGDGSISELIARGHNAGTTRLIGAVPATFIAPAVATRGGQIFALTAQGAPGSGSNTLYRVNNGTVRALADIGAYQITDPDPYNVTLQPEESNPFGVAPLPDGSVLVSDAAANDLLRVYPNGSIETVARLKPRLVPSPGFPGLPPAGVMILSEAVATSVAVGADGYYYVGELRGFPATPGKSEIWRIAPNSLNAVCDPLIPNSGPCQRYKDGFTSIVDLEAGEDGSLYVVELSKQSWLAMQIGLPGSQVGGVFRISPGGGVSELAPNQLIMPAGIAVADDAVYVSSPVFGPAALLRVQ